MKELIMCYRIPADAEKTVSESRLSSSKESVLTPQKDIDELEIQSLMSESGFAAMLHKLLAPFSKEKGGHWQTDGIVSTASDDTSEVEKVS